MGCWQYIDLAMDLGLGTLGLFLTVPRWPPWPFQEPWTRWPIKTSWVFSMWPPGKEPQFPHSSCPPNIHLFLSNFACSSDFYSYPGTYYWSPLFQLSVQSERVTSTSSSLSWAPKPCVQPSTRYFYVVKPLAPQCILQTASTISPCWTCFTSYVLVSS